MNDPDPRRPVEIVVAEDPDFPPADVRARIGQGPRADLSRITLHMLGHAHIDLGYRWDLKETIERIGPATFRGVLALMERTGGLTFCQTQMFLYAAMQSRQPEIFQAILRRVREGRWEVTGGAWCEYDAILPSGESVIRQHLQGLRYAADELGVESNEVAFVPDSFIGHAATLPQILAGCGIRWYLFGRGLPPGLKRAFRWVGPDGSGLVAYLPFGPYSNRPLTPEALRALEPYAEAGVGDDELALYGLGDHGGGPRDADVAALEAMRSDPQAPRWRYDTAHAFFRGAFDAERVSRLQEYRGSLRCFATGALVSQAQTKRSNRLCEHLLVQTEAIAAMATSLQRKPAHPRVDFVEAWRDLLTLQFHDILPGTSAGPVYRQAAEAYASLRRRAEDLLEDGLTRICSRLDTTGDGFPLVLVNAGFRPASAVVTTEVPEWVLRAGPAVSRVLDDQGREQPFVFDGERLSVLARVPALGYRLWRVHAAAGGPEQQPGAPQPARLPPDGMVRRGAFAVRLDPATGVISGVWHKGRLILDGAFGLELNEEEEKSTAWVQALTGQRRAMRAEPPRVAAQDRFRTVVRGAASSRWSRFAWELTLYEELPRIDFAIDVDWQDSDALLELAFAAPDWRRGSPRLTAALPHGHAGVSDPGREIAMHDWIDVNGAGGGVTLFTDGSYGARLADGSLGVAVIRRARDMDPAMARGPHRLRVGLLPYEGAFKPSRAARELAGFLAPLHARWDNAHRGGLVPWGRYDNSRSLAPAGSFLSVSEENVEICACKLPEEQFTPDALVIRLRETDGVAARATLSLGLACAELWRADHLERPLEQIAGQSGLTVQVDLRPREIVTLLARLQAR